MYHNPLITIPRLQHSENQAGYPHSHPHQNRRAAVGRDDFGESGVAEAKIAPRTATSWDDEGTYQAGVGTAQSKKQQAGRIAPSTSTYSGTADVESGLNQKFASSGATTGALGNNVGGSAELEGGGIWGSIKGVAGDVAGGVKDFVTGSGGDANVGLQGAFASNITAPLTDGQKVTSEFDETGGGDMDTAANVPWTAQQWTDAGYTQQPDGSWDIAPKKAGILPLVGSAGGLDAVTTETGELEGGIEERKAFSGDPDLEIPDYWQHGEAFGEGMSPDKMGIGKGPWDAQKFEAAYRDMMQNFWIKDEKFGTDQQGIGTAAQEIFGAGAGRGGGFGGAREGAYQDLSRALDQFYKSSASLVHPDRSFTANQKQEIIYHELKKMAQQSYEEMDADFNEEDFNTFAQERLGLTEENITAYGGTVERIEAATDEIEAEPSPIGTLEAETNQYMADVSNIVKMMSGGATMAAGIYSGSMVDKINQPVQIPEGYEVIRDIHGQPQLEYKGRIAGYRDDGTPRYKHTGKDGGPLQRPNEAQLQAINSALQMKEMGQKTMHEYMGKQLGLNIKRQEGQIVSNEFTKKLEHSGNQLALERDKFESNESLAQAEVLGIFTDEQGNELNTLNREQLMAKLTGQVGKMVTKRRLDRETGEVITWQEEEMEDTVEMQKMKSDLLGTFMDAKGEMQSTITKQQFDAAVKGYLQDKPTFAREQFMEQQSMSRNAAITEAGFVMAQKFEVDDEGNITSTEMYADPATGQPTTVATGGQRLKTMEARRLELDEQIAQAKINQNQTIDLPVLDDDGNVTLDENEQPITSAVTVNYLDRLRMNLDQQRLDHMMAMEATAMIGKDEAGNETMEARRLGIEESRVGIEETRAETEGKRVDVQSQDIEARAETRALEIGVEEQRAQAELQRAGVSSAQEARALGLQQAQIAAQKEEGLTAQRGGLGQFAETDAATMATGRQTYMTGLNDALKSATATKFEDLEAAVSAAMPPVPAGMVWSADSGSLVFRRGYEGRDISPETQREIEQIQPVLRARDRAEKVLVNLQTHKFELETTNRTIDNESQRIRDALATGDIVEAEEAAYIRRNAETSAIVMRAKNEKYSMVLQLIQSPVALGLAKHTGILASIQADLGFEISNVPTIDGDAAAVPTINDWLNYTPEEKSLKQALWVQETGGDLETLQQLIQGTAPGGPRQLQYSVT